MKKTFAWLTLLAATAGTQAQEQQVNIICSVQAEWCNLLQTVYARSTGAKVNMSLKGSGEALAQLIAERLALIFRHQIGGGVVDGGLGLSSRSLGLARFQLQRRQGVLALSDDKGGIMRFALDASPAARAQHSVNVVRIGEGKRTGHWPFRRGDMGAHCLSRLARPTVERGVAKA